MQAIMNQTTLFALAEFPRQLAAHYAAIPAEFKHWKPGSWDGIPSERYTALEQICHVRDIEIDGYHLRLQRTLDEAHPFLPAVDGDLLAVERSYATAEATAVLAEFSTARAHTIDLISRLTAEQLARTAEFEDYGALTLRSLVHYLCSHDQQHLAGLQWLLGQIEALPALRS
jgi:DinB superfamily